MKQLIITEKPSVAQALADYFNSHGNICTKQRGHFIIKEKDTYIAWASGHLMTPYEPGDYKKEWEGAWWKTPLPIIPDAFKRKVMKNKRDTYDHIQKLIKESDVIINAADPDREGQTLGDEILEGKTAGKPVKRLLLNALDDDSIAKALADIKDNTTFQGLYEAGKTRTNIDWIIGMNLTRFFTVEAKKGGYQSKDTVAVGRVKAPTVALIVKRQQEINSFKPVIYYAITAQVNINGNIVKAEYDSKEKIINEVDAINIVNRCTGKNFTITNQQKENHQELVKQLYSLDTLQIDADKTENISAKDTLAAVQSLYEKKHVTYPRSDCKYLPESQKKDAIEIATLLNNSISMEIGIIPLQSDNTHLMTSPVWNDKKITAHHAIVPTKNIPDLSKLSATEKKIYLLIVRKYAGIFVQPYTYEIMKFTGYIEGYPFKFQAKKVINRGYTLFYPNKNKDENEIEIRGNVSINSQHPVKEIKQAKKQTQPPKPYTEGTLISKMANIQSENESYNKILSQIKGIGTPATRAKIIDEIIHVNKHVEKKGKYLYPTEKGKQLIAILPKMLTEADYTAKMEEELTQIEQNTMQPNIVIQRVINDVKSIIDSDIQIINKEYPCPKCHEGYLLQKKYTSKYYNNEQIDEYRCSNTECKIAFPTVKNKPKIVPCPACNKGFILKRHGKYGIFYGCSEYPTCKKTFTESEFEELKGILNT